jgi:hypothetical protein
MIYLIQEKKYKKTVTILEKTIIEFEEKKWRIKQEKIDCFFVDWITQLSLLRSITIHTVILFL